MKNALIFIWEVAKIVIIALLIVVPVRYFVFQPFFVKGQSMEPNFSDGDYLIVDEITYRFRPPQRGEVIVFKYPDDPSQRYIKRIIGLPGEIIEIEQGKVIIYSVKEEGGITLEESDYLSSPAFTSGDLRITLSGNEYFVLGDNRTASADSRRWGPLPLENIIGRALIRAWPPTALAKIEAPAY
jgi:signal peptidase I